MGEQTILKAFVISCNGQKIAVSEYVYQIQVRDRKKIFRNFQKFLLPSVLHTSDSFKSIAKNFFEIHVGSLK